MIKGHVTIDLHNHNSGFKERIEQDNLVTDAVGILASVYAGASMTEQIMPLATKALGGLMLFDGALREEKSNIHFPADVHLTGFAGQWNNTSDCFCGSINTQETHATDTGFETVWDFSTSQANGTIASISLTAAPDSDNIGNPFTGRSKQVKVHSANRYETNVSAIVHAADQMMYFLKKSFKTGGEYLSVEHDQDRGIYIYKSEVDVMKAYMPLRKYKVADNSNRADELVKVKSIEVKTESTKNENIRNTNPAEYAVNAYDGYAYFVYPQGNDLGDGVFTYQRIKISDYSFDTEEPVKITLPDTRLKGGFNSATVCKGKCFLIGKDERYIYIVDLANTADVKTADLGEGMHCNPYMALTANQEGTVLINTYKDDYTVERNTYNAIIYPDGEVRMNGTSGGWVDSSGKMYSLLTDSFIAYKRNEGFPVMNYLGTICNLASPITKTAAMSMKITYTLTDEVQA